MIVLATDAPLEARQIQRLCVRAGRAWRGWEVITVTAAVISSSDLAQPIGLNTNQLG